MAGKSSKGRNRRSSNSTVNSLKLEALASAAVKDNSNAPDYGQSDANGLPDSSQSASANPQAKEPETVNAVTEPKHGDLHLYPISVKTQSGEKLELQGIPSFPSLFVNEIVYEPFIFWLNPGDSVMDIRQFLLDAPETSFFTCYNLLLHTKDGSTHRLEDHNEISVVADITVGGCCLEMVAAPYDDRSIRSHVHRSKELLSLSTLHASLSTSLVLENETAQNKATVSDAARAEVSELDGLGYMEDVAGSLNKLLPSASKEIKCVDSIVFSSFNPPPSYRRLVGDLIYLDIVTLEGNKYCITGTTKMFYVNSSTGSVLDPRPSKATLEATTLIGLLQKVSSKFKKAFRDILERKASAHPFENVQSLLPLNSWLGAHPITDHRRDAARAEDALTLSYGSELIGMQRDWNEELQSCREFPHTTLQEQILRNRALYKVNSDFVRAAINGAIGVIRRCIPPINPTDPECFHMYVHNNIFFSFAVDADLERLSKQRTPDANLKIENTGSLLSSSENDSNDLLRGENGTSDGKKCDGTTIEEVNGIMDLTFELSAEMQLADSEQATYASANNDLKGTKAYQEADIPGLYNLAMAIIDYRGHRVVAQSVLPGILQGDKSDSLLYGSVDNGKKIYWNEDFHSKVLEAAKRLHLKEHMVLDGSGTAFRLAAPVECKGIVGSDDRHYLLDLMRVTPRDANYTGPGSQFCIFRPELIAAFCQAQAAERLKSKAKMVGGSSEVAGDEEQLRPDAFLSSASSDNKEINKDENSEDVKKSAPVPTEDSESYNEILFNPNVFTEFKLAGSPEEIVADEENARKASLYLVNTVLPKFIQDLCTLEVSPMDGQTLTEALHAHGINVRYLGKVANGTQHLPHIWDFCINEIVVRSAKHILKDVLRELDDDDLGPAISHFFNCFFGYLQAAGMKTMSRAHKKDQARGHSKMKAVSARKNQSSYMSMSSDSLWSDIEEFAKLKYQFELPEDARFRLKKVHVIRNFCLKVGIRIAAHKYDLNASTPFQTSDILDLQPVVKHSGPICTEAKDLVETGKAQLAEGMLAEAYTSFSEAFSILQQVTGPMHQEVANCSRYLAMVLYHAGDMAEAIIQQHKELIINERCLGLDHPDTAHSYGNMALFYHGLNQTELALGHMSRALLLLSLSSGPDHPDVAATFINVAMMYQDIGKMNTALRYLQEALKKNERLLGKEHIQTAVCYHALAIAFNCMGAFKLSHQHEKKTYDILVKQLGEDDSRTHESQNWLKAFKMQELQMNAKKQQDQALNAVSTQKAIDILKAHPHLIQAFQGAAVAEGSGSASINKSLNAAIIGESLPGGRRVDERAARAAAEARKKAAARGLLIQPHGVPVQVLPPLTQLFNFINSGVTPAAVENEEANGVKKEVDGQHSDDQIDGNKNETLGPEKAPVGLGKGLATQKKENKR